MNRITGMHLGARGIHMFIGEGSDVGVERTDTELRDPIGWFSTRAEDCTPKHLLVSQYDTWLD
ncbi:D-lyxose/D-mannose family sugar isomerase [Pacificibacter maritimus]|uniref:D-lyxose/D-mannose family sugar isomerase n=1 Tax=Pacificibacter maritimus TaxID=762213 RepID=UPI0011CDD985|nr:D-lyxose/D-mannose family sugar isomerase [Pacificibacter maritimus]